MNEPMNATVASTLWPSRARLRLVRAAMLAIGGTLLLAASAKAQVPFYPVPMTLQTLAVLAIGAAYGARLAGATLLLYLGEGLAGLPVFAGVGAGPGYMAGPTGGFLVGFLVAAALVGWLAERGWGRSAPRLVGAMLLGQIALYALGAAWLASFIGLDKAWRFGALPFLFADAVKTLLAAALIGAAARALGRAPSDEA